MSDLTPVPTLSKFVEEVGKEPQWFSLGVHLNLAHDDLKSIENQYSCQGTNRCAAELFICYEKNKKPCWKHITRAFEKIGDHNHAGQIRDKYCNLFEQLLSTQKDDNREDTPSDIEDLEYNPAGGILDAARNTSLSPVYETVQVETKVVRDFDHLRAQYSMLETEVKNVLQAQSISLDLLQQFLYRQRKLKPFSSEKATLDNVYKRVCKRCSFLYYYLLEDLVEFFLGGVKQLHDKFEKYKSDLEQFKESTSMKDLSEKLTGELPGRGKVIKLKLADIWDNVVIKRFETLVRVLFCEPNKHIREMKVSKGTGCMLVYWKVTKISNNRLLRVQTKFPHFLKALGVLCLSVDNEVIFKQTTRHNSEFTTLY